MPDRRDDDLDSWLNQRIDPLAPPPGTFDLIKRRSRRRKYRKLAITAASAAVIVAAAVTVPQVVNLRESPSPSAQAAAGQSSAAASASASAGGGSAAASGAATVPSPSPSAAPVPANFRPTSVTFVGTSTGWVIGQAGTPGRCATQYCTSMARTGNAGKTWAGVPAPLAGAASGATGVSQVRFLNLQNGWAFGPELFATTNGGQTWTRVDTNGLRVTDLEAVGNRVFAVFASCTGSGTDFAADCTSFTLYSATAGSGTWTPVGAATSGLTDGAASEAVLTLTSTRGFLLAPDGKLYAGPVDGSGGWQLVNAISPSCPVQTPQADGQPAGALLGAVSARELILACTTSTAGGQKKLIFSSLNGGGSWIQMAAAPTAGTATSIAASPSVSVVLATDRGIDLLPAGDTSWQAASLAAPLPAGGFSYIGMTTDQQGIALPASPAAGTVWFTFDGGKSWQPSPVTG